MLGSFSFSILAAAAYWGARFCAHARLRYSASRKTGCVQACMYARMGMSFHPSCLPRTWTMRYFKPIKPPTLQCLVEGVKRGVETRCQQREAESNSGIATADGAGPQSWCWTTYPHHGAVRIREGVRRGRRKGKVSVVFCNEKSDQYLQLSPRRAWGCKQHASSLSLTVELSLRSSRQATGNEVSVSSK
eukprot:1159286-Pelagomonas_calceolata.AAC.9